MKAFLAFFVLVALLATKGIGQNSRQRSATSPSSKATSSNAQFKNIFRTSLDQENLNGKVRFIYEAYYLARRSKKTNELIVHDSIQIEFKLRYFDEAGNEVLDTAANYNYTAYAITKYKYAKPGQLIEATDNSTGEKWSYEYNENGFITKETYYFDKEAPGEITFREYEFSNANNYSYKIFKVGSQKAINCVARTIYPDGRLKTEITGCDSASARKKVYTYAPGSNRLIRYDYYNIPGNLYEHAEYDNKGNEIKKVDDASLSTDKIETFEYPSYDAAGNWTKKIGKKDSAGVIFSITERKIKYY